MAYNVTLLAHRLPSRHHENEQRTGKILQRKPKSAREEVPGILLRRPIPCRATQMMSPQWLNVNQEDYGLNGLTDVSA